GAHGAV
ncbi:hypothetical protein A2U01_0117253, partial [Trifolium medium]|nr:hypothetical protein [Trifolium medium]